jgi:hypothetical protein
VLRHAQCTKKKMKKKKTRKWALIVCVCFFFGFLACLHACFLPQEMVEQLKQPGKQAAIRKDPNFATFGSTISQKTQGFVVKFGAKCIDKVKDTIPVRACDRLPPRRHAMIDLPTDGLMDGLLD